MKNKNKFKISINNISNVLIYFLEVYGILVFIESCHLHEKYQRNIKYIFKCTKFK